MADITLLQLQQMIGTVSIELDYKELSRDLRISRKLADTREDVLAKVRLRYRRNLSKYMGGLSNEIETIGGRVADYYSLNESELIGRIWDELAKQFADNNREWQVKFLTDLTFHNRVLNRTIKFARIKVWKSNKRSIEELTMFENLEKGLELADRIDRNEARDHSGINSYTDSANRVVRVMSSGSGPRDIWGNRPAVYVDGTGKLDTGIRSNKRVTDAIYSRLPSPDNIDEYGDNMSSAFSRYENRILAYFGPNKTPEAYRVMDLLNAVITSYRAVKTEEKADKESVVAFNKGQVRWEKRRNSEKGKFANVRDFLGIGDDVSLDIIRNEATRWAQIGLYREPHNCEDKAKQGRCDCRRLWSKTRARTAEYRINGGFSKPVIKGIYVGAQAPDMFMWTPEYRSNKTNDPAPTTWSLGSYKWRIFSEDDSKVTWIMLPDYMKTHRSEPRGYVANADLIPYDVTVKYRSQETGNMVEWTRVQHTDIDRIGRPGRDSFALSNQVIFDLVRGGYHPDYRNISPEEEAAYLQSLSEVKAEKFHNYGSIEADVIAELETNLAALRSKIRVNNSSTNGRVSRKVAAALSSGLYR